MNRSESLVDNTLISWEEIIFGFSSFLQMYHLIYNRWTSETYKHLSEKRDPVSTQTKISHLVNFLFLFFGWG